MGNTQSYRRKRPLRLPRPDSVTGTQDRPVVDASGAVHARGNAQMKAFAAMGQMAVKVV